MNDLPLTWAFYESKQEAEKYKNLRFSNLELRQDLDKLILEVSKIKEKIDGKF